jgi:HPt (histidine-containing phosphotransfer) domain-containing protein
LCALQPASDAGDLEALAFQAHAIKSASAAVGLLALSETARALEAGARATPDDVDVGHQASLLATECDRAITAMRAALAGGQLWPMTLSSAPTDLLLEDRKAYYLERQTSRLP